MGHTAIASKNVTHLLTRDELLTRLHVVGEERYHHCHPFHLRMHQGLLTNAQIQAWVLNRYYYQSRIPIKDSIILSRGDAEFRRVWRKRVIDHDGTEPGTGGIECWLQLAEAAGLNRSLVESCDHVLPSTRYAVDAYLELVSKGPFLQAVASSLTELFSGRLIALRMDALKMHYPRLASGFDYFQARLTQAPEDSEFAFNYVYNHARTPEEQELIVSSLSLKCDILWAQLDALYFAYVEPGFAPPGALRFQKEDDAQ